MARPKSPEKSIHTAVRLPQDLHAQLSKAGHGALAEEIKRRLAWSFWWDELDPPTRELLSATLRMAGLIHGDTRAPWHANAYLRAAFAAAISAWLAERVPGDANTSGANASASTSSSAAWLRDGDTAEAAGAALLRLYKSSRATEEALERYQQKLRTDPIQRWAEEQSRREPTKLIQTSKRGAPIEEPQPSPPAPKKRERKR